MNTIIANRLKSQMAKLDINASELAKRSDVKPSFIYDIVNGKSTNPSTIKLARVADAMGVSISYLVGNDDYPHPRPHAPAASEPVDYVSISRILVDASAGGGSITTAEHEGEPYYFRKSWIRDRLGVSASDLRLLFIRGDSMEPTLYHNDIILVDVSKTFPSPPGIFILFDGFGLVAKRIEFITNSKPEALRIISDNPQYTTYSRLLSETNIVGRVVWFAREM